jgi:hypothetical protein
MPKKVEIHGLTLELPDDQADAVIKARDADKDARRAIEARLAEIEGKAKAADEASRKAAEEAERTKLVNKGEYEKALQIEREANQKRIDALAGKYRTTALERQIAAIPGVLPGAVKDLATMLERQVGYDLEKDALTVVNPPLGKDGKPLDAAAFVQQFITERPHFRAATGSPGSGAAGTGQPGAATIRRADLATVTPTQRADLIAGKLTVID